MPKHSLSWMWCFYYCDKIARNCVVMDSRRVKPPHAFGWLCWGLTSQSIIFQSCQDGAIASWVINQYFRGVKCLAQGHNTAAVGLELRTSRSGVRHSTTEPPHSPAPACSSNLIPCIDMWQDTSHPPNVGIFFFFFFSVASTQDTRSFIGEGK